MRAAAVAAVLALAPGALCAQAAQGAQAAPPPPGPTILTLWGSLAFVHNISSFDSAPAGLSRNGAAGSLRLMWQPGRLLSAGLEIGRTHVYSVSQTLPAGQYEQSLDAWPVMAVFAMAPSRRLSLQLGTGFSINTADVSLAAGSGSSSGFGGTWMASALYQVPLSRKFALGSELRVQRLTQYEDTNLSLSITLGWRLMGP